MIGNVNYFDACYAALKINNANTTEIIQRSNQLQHRCTITRWKPKFARDFDQTQKGIACGLAILYRNCATSRLNSNALPINRLKFPGKKNNSSRIGSLFSVSPPSSTAILYARHALQISGYRVTAMQRSKGQPFLWNFDGREEGDRRRLAYRSIPKPEDRVRARKRIMVFTRRENAITRRERSSGKCIFDCVSDTVYPDIPNGYVLCMARDACNLYWRHFFASRRDTTETALCGCSSFASNVRELREIPQWPTEIFKITESSFWKWNY